LETVGTGFPRKVLINGSMDNPDSVKAVVMQNCGHRQLTAKQKSLLLLTKSALFSALQPNLPR
jgi:hypothetical protein